jgi:hypothetical protein
MNLDLSIQFKKRELINTKDMTLSALQILILNDISFSIIIFIWYVLFYYFGINISNPFFALSISLLQNIAVFIYLLKNKQSTESLIKYLIILIIIKIIPLISLFIYNKISINYFDVYITIYLYIIYLFVIIIINNIFLNNKINVTELVKGEISPKYKENILDEIYDKSYNDVIKQII